MPRNSATGVYTAPGSTFNPASSGTPISPSDWNTLRDDMATALTQAPTSTRALYPTAGQVQDQAFTWCGTAGGTANALTLTPTPAIAAYAAGQVFSFLANATNTAAATVNVSGLGTKALVAPSGKSLLANNIYAGSLLSVSYDGTSFRLVSPISQTVSVRDFGALGDGSTDDTTAFQAALNSGAMQVIVPPSSAGYVVGNLVMPATPYFVLDGCGTAGFLKMKASAGKLITWNTGSIVYTQGAIRNLAIDGSNGSDHAIDTSGVGGLTMDGIYIKNPPAGKAGIRVNGAASTYSHDTRLMNIQIYDNGAGANDGILIDSLGADVEIVDYICNGNFLTNYALRIAANAGTVQMIGGHPYNAKINILKADTSLTNLRFVGVYFDNAQSNLVVMTDSTGPVFEGCRFCAINSGYSGLVLTNTDSARVIGGAFDGQNGSVSAVKETGTSDYTVVRDPMIGADNFADFSAPFNLIGANSQVRGIYNNNLLGYKFPFAFVGTAAQTAGQTLYYGPAGQQSSSGYAEWVAPQAAILSTCYVACSAAPGSGQSFTVTLAKNGTTVATGSISGASSFSVSLSIPALSAVAVGDRITVAVTSSAGAASAVMRGVFTATA